MLSKNYTMFCYLFCITIAASKCHNIKHLTINLSHVTDRVTELELNCISIWIRENRYQLQVTERVSIGKARIFTAIDTELSVTADRLPDAIDDDETTDCVLYSCLQPPPPPPQGPPTEWLQTEQLALGATELHASMSSMTIPLDGVVASRSPPTVVTPPECVPDP